MAILVDDCNWPWRGMLFCHMISDTSLDELHAFARWLGVSARRLLGQPLAALEMDGEAMAQQFLRLLPRLFEGNEGDVRQALEPLVKPGEPIPPEAGPDEANVDMDLLFGLMGILSLAGAQPGAPETTPDGRVTIPVQAPPVRLVMVQVEGQWKVDLRASWALLPEPLRAVAEGPAREKATTETCLSNLKQLALAALMFAADHDNQLPSADKWTDEVIPYVKNEAILKCPAAPELECAYALNRALAGKNHLAIPRLAEEIIFFESNLGKRNATGTVQDLADPPRHQGGNNYAFADGHCKWSHELPGSAPPPAGPGAGGPAPPAE